MSYSCNDNQNYFVSAGRTTSRVLNPPGGASSFTLGLPEQPKTKEQQKVETAGAPSSASVSANHATTAPSPRVEVVVAAAAPAVIETPAPSPALTTTAGSSPPSPPAAPYVPGGAFAGTGGTAPVSANAFASGANMNGANVLTGRPTSRVLAPPGGHSASGGSLW